MSQSKKMVKNYVQITVLKELEDLITPLTREEFEQLENSIRNEGCRESLIVWEKSKSENILVDGHNRYKICSKNGIAFDIKKVKFSGIDEVKAWMIDNQLGRRNLNPDQLSYYRGYKYLALKKNKGGYANVKSKGQNEPSTSELLSDQFKVSESTIKRDSKFAEGLDIIGFSNQELKRKILSGETKVKKSDIQILSDSKDPLSLVIKNEADLSNKAKILKDLILDEVENSINRIENERIDKAKDMLTKTEPLFIERDQRLIRIKGMILSAINKAINDRNVNSIQELKNLIERLEHELLE